ncbi:MAG TPA: hypothetical protein VJ481_00490 [Patescibacteria group bacterium]|uniref:DUF2029 domain-containing protein n=1 Tax=Candidatus Woesebacteria bacterium RBG_13_46_13 TaxID=1802479 RepID=A0A1F7X358_9BACT|nr:MAG: hypothetical protein A2Y68_00360 [Candidatus Woesebacteria bacterium RBG_13_46_13]HJX59021.1 hypothetical protein [Patescibacteria group bacterium]
MKSKIIKILLIGIVLRIILSLATYHSDVAPFDFAGGIIAKGNIANFYDYLWNLPQDSPILAVYPKNLFNYPPAVYFFLGPATRVVSWIVDPAVHANFILNFSSTLGNWQLNLLLLLLKLPYFAFDIAVAYLLMALFKTDREKLLGFSFWIFNPVNLYATYMVGQFDIIPVFFSVLCLYLVVKKKDVGQKSLLLEALLLGLGGAFKIFPLLFLVPLASLKKSWLERIKIVTVGVLAYIATILPFIASKGFRTTALLAGQTTKSLYAQIPLSGGESIMLFLVFVIFFYLVFLFKTSTVELLWKRFFIMMLIFFIFTHYHPQWFLWLTPFMIIDLVKHLKHWVMVALSLVSFVFLVSFFDPGLSVWLFAPIWPKLYGLPGIWQLVGVSPDINQMRSIFQSLFVGVAFYYLYILFPKSQEAKE